MPLIFSLAAATGTGAQELPSSSNRSDPVDLERLNGERPSTTIAPTSVPPEIDGRLNEEVWRIAPVILEFEQVLPVEGAEPSERTEVRLLHDEKHLYIGVRLHDAEPDRIIAKQMLRDASQGSDDHVSIAIDPFLDRRNAFFFELNPVGARRDGLIEDNSDLRTDWDGVWYGAGAIDEEGWTAEFSIPFQTISFDPDAPAWGLNIERFIRRRNETVRWTAVSQNKSIRTVADYGNLVGMKEIEQGLGLDFVPFFAAKYRLEDENGEDGWELEPGFDLFYKITPSLTAALTVNTDFAEAEVDERRVNLTRFPLFFPEKRDFFLQDAYVFDFGGIRRTPLPFFSRRIGIGPGGREVPIEAGLKITGNADRWNVGLLGVQTEDALGIDAKTLAVGRVAYQFAEESTIGAIVTSGAPRSNDDNNLIGFDLNLRESNFIGENAIEGHAWFQSSHTSGEDGREYAWGGSINYPNDRVNWDFFFGHIDEEFDPALGFVSRRGIREYGGGYRYRWRPERGLRRIDLRARGQVFTTLDNEVETQELSFPSLTFENDPGDQLTFDLEFNREQLFEPFEIREGIVIPVGDYHFPRVEADLRTSDGRPISANLEVSTGEFFNGTRTDYEAELEFRPSRHIFSSLGFELNDVNLPDGDFITRLLAARLNIYFTPDLSWNTLAQYDNVSETLGVNSRIRWEVEPGSELFLVFNTGFDVDGTDLRSRSTELTTKVGWTFRF